MIFYEESTGCWMDMLLLACEQVPVVRWHCSGAVAVVVCGLLIGLWWSRWLSPLDSVPRTLRASDPYHLLDQDAGRGLSRIYYLFVAWETLPRW